MKYLYVILIFILTGCTFTEPSTIIIQNKSDYCIEVSLNKGHKEKVNIEKNKGDFIMTSPGDIKLEVFVPDIMYKKEYNITLNYLEKKKFTFSLE